MNFRVAHCIASKKSRFSHFFLWTFENCHLVCQPHKTIGKIQQTSESLNRAFEQQLELQLHQNNLFFRFEISLRKSDALIFRRSVFFFLSLLFPFFWPRGGGQLPPLPPLGSALALCRLLPHLLLWVLLYRIHKIKALFQNQAYIQAWQKHLCTGTST